MLHTYIQFSMLHFLAEQLVILILCPYRSLIARISRASSNFSPVKLKMVRGCLACSFALGREKGCYCCIVPHTFCIPFEPPVSQCRGEVVSQDLKASTEWSPLCEEGCLFSFSCSHPIPWSPRVAVVSFVVVQSASHHHLKPSKERGCVPSLLWCCIRPTQDCR